MGNQISLFYNYTEVLKIKANKLMESWVTVNCMCRNGLREISHLK